MAVKPSAWASGWERLTAPSSGRGCRPWPRRCARRSGSRRPTCPPPRRRKPGARRPTAWPGPGMASGCWGRTPPSPDPWRRSFVTTAGIIQAIVEQAAQDLAAAQRLQPLAEESALAKSHRTRYPMVQGPMTRVSDTAAFAEAVAEAGALPFLALALLRQAETEALLKETRNASASGPGASASWASSRRRSARNRSQAIRTLPPALCPDRRRPARPGPGAGEGGHPDLSARAVAGTAAAVPARWRAPLHLRGPRVRRPRRPAHQLRPLGDACAEVLLEHLGTSGRGDDLAVLFAGRHPRCAVRRPWSPPWPPRSPSAAWPSAS